MAAPAFRAAAWGEDASSTSPWFADVTKPAGTVDNDILLAMTMWGAGSGTIGTPPTGFASITSVTNATGHKVEWWWKRASGEGATYTWTNTAGGGGAFGVSMIAYSGCITTGTPYEDATTAGGGAAETTPDTATIDTTGPDRMVVCMCGIEDNTSFSSGYPPAGGWASRQNQLMANGTDLASAIIELEVASASTVTSVVIGTLAASELWASLTLALIPPAAGSDVFNDRRTPRRRSIQRW